MKKLNLDTNVEKIEVTVGGKPYVLTYPSWGDVEEIEEKGENLTTIDIKKFMLDRGLTNEAIKVCQMTQLKDLYIELIGLKKS